MSKTTQPPDDLLFPNARPVQPEKAPLNSSLLKERLPVIPVVPLNPFISTDMLTCKARQKNRPRQNFTTSRDIVKFRHHFLKLLRLMGFTDYFFQQLPCTSKPKHPFTTLPRQLRAIYEKEKLFEHDMALQHVNATGSPIFMSSIEDVILKSSIKPDSFHRYSELISISKHFGYHDFYYTPLKAQDGGYHALLAVTSKDMNSTDFIQMVQDHESEFQLLAHAWYLYCAGEFPGLFRDSQSRGTRLNQSRPLQLLERMAKEDLALKQVSDKLCIAIDTANKHMATAKRILGVRTQTGAVYRAIKTGLILID